MRVYKNFHMCLDIQGVLEWDRSEFNRRIAPSIVENGSPVTPERARQLLYEQLLKGHSKLPIGKPCEGFSYQEGCPGHVVKDSETTIKDAV